MAAPGDEADETECCAGYRIDDVPSRRNADGDCIWLADGLCVRVPGALRERVAGEAADEKSDGGVNWRLSSGSANGCLLDLTVAGDPASYDALVRLVLRPGDENPVS